MPLSPEQVDKLKDLRTHMQHITDRLPDVDDMLATYGATAEAGESAEAEAGEREEEPSKPGRARPRGRYARPNPFARKDNASKE